MAKLLRYLIGDLVRIRIGKYYVNANGNKEKWIKSFLNYDKKTILKDHFSKTIISKKSILDKCINLDTNHRLRIQGPIQYKNFLAPTYYQSFSIKNVIGELLIKIKEIIPKSVMNKIIKQRKIRKKLIKTNFLPSKETKLLPAEVRNRLNKSIFQKPEVNMGIYFFQKSLSENNISTTRTLSTIASRRKMKAASKKKLRMGKKITGSPKASLDSSETNDKPASSKEPSDLNSNKDPSEKVKKFDFPGQFAKMVAYVKRYHKKLKDMVEEEERKERIKEEAAKKLEDETKSEAEVKLEGKSVSNEKSPRNLESTKENQLSKKESVDEIGGRAEKKEREASKKIFVTLMKQLIESTKDKEPSPKPESANGNKMSKKESPSIDENGILKNEKEQDSIKKKRSASIESHEKSVTMKESFRKPGLTEENQLSKEESPSVDEISIRKKERGQDLSKKKRSARIERPEESITMKKPSRKLDLTEENQISKEGSPSIDEISIRKKERGQDLSKKKRSDRIERPEESITMKKPSRKLDLTEENHISKEESPSIDEISIHKSDFGKMEKHLIKRSLQETQETEGNDISKEINKKFATRKKKRIQQRSKDISTIQKDEPHKKKVSYLRVKKNAPCTKNEDTCLEKDSAKEEVPCNDKVEVVWIQTEHSNKKEVNSGHKMECPCKKTKDCCKKESEPHHEIECPHKKMRDFCKKMDARRKENKIQIQRIATPPNKVKSPINFTENFYINTIDLCKKKTDPFRKVNHYISYDYNEYFLPCKKKSFHKNKLNGPFKKENKNTFYSKKCHKCHKNGKKCFNKKIEPCHNDVDPLSFLKKRKHASNKKKKKNSFEAFLDKKKNTEKNDTDSVKRGVDRYKNIHSTEQEKYFCRLRNFFIPVRRNVDVINKIDVRYKMNNEPLMGRREDHFRTKLYTYREICRKAGDTNKKTGQNGKTERVLNKNEKIEQLDGLHRNKKYKLKNKRDLCKKQDGVGKLTKDSFHKEDICEKQDNPCNFNKDSNKNLTICSEEQNATYGPTVQTEIQCKMTTDCNNDTLIPTNGKTSEKEVKPDGKETDCEKNKEITFEHFCRCIDSQLKKNEKEMDQCEEKNNLFEEEKSPPVIHSFFPCEKKGSPLETSNVCMEKTNHEEIFPSETKENQCSKGEENYFKKKDNLQINKMDSSSVEVKPWGNVFPCRMNKRPIKKQLGTYIKNVYICRSLDSQTTEEKYPCNVKPYRYHSNKINECLRDEQTHPCKNIETISAKESVYCKSKETNGNTGSPCERCENPRKPKESIKKNKYPFNEYKNQRNQGKSLAENGPNRKNPNTIKNVISDLDMTPYSYHPHKKNKSPYRKKTNCLRRDASFINKRDPSYCINESKIKTCEEQKDPCDQNVTMNNGFEKQEDPCSKSEPRKNHCEEKNYPCKWKKGLIHIKTNSCHKKEVSQQCNIDQNYIKAGPSVKEGFTNKGKMGPKKKKAGPYQKKLVFPKWKENSFKIKTDHCQKSEVPPTLKNKLNKNKSDPFDEREDSTCRSGVGYKMTNDVTSIEKIPAKKDETSYISLKTSTGKPKKEQASIKVNISDNKDDSSSWKKEPVLTKALPCEKKQSFSKWKKKRVDIVADSYKKPKFFQKAKPEQIPEKADLREKQKTQKEEIYKVKVGPGEKQKIPSKAKVDQIPMKAYPREKQKNLKKERKKIEEDRVKKQKIPSKAMVDQIPIKAYPREKQKNQKEDLNNVKIYPDGKQESFQKVEVGQIPMKAYDLEMQKHKEKELNEIKVHPGEKQKIPRKAKVDQIPMKAYPHGKQKNQKEDQNKIKVDPEEKQISPKGVIELNLLEPHPGIKQKEAGIKCIADSKGMRENHKKAIKIQANPYEKYKKISKVKEEPTPMTIGTNVYNKQVFPEWKKNSIQIEAVSNKKQMVFGKVKEKLISRVQNIPTRKTEIQNNMVLDFVNFEKIPIKKNVKSFNESKEPEDKKTNSSKMDEETSMQGDTFKCTYSHLMSVIPCQPKTDHDMEKMNILVEEIYFDKIKPYFLSKKEESPEKNKVGEQKEIKNEKKITLSQKIVDDYEKKKQMIKGSGNHSPSKKIQYSKKIRKAPEEEKNLCGQDKVSYQMIADSTNKSIVPIKRNVKSPKKRMSTDNKKAACTKMKEETYKKGDVPGCLNPQYTTGAPCQKKIDHCKEKTNPCREEICPLGRKPTISFTKIENTLSKNDANEIFQPVEKKQVQNKRLVYSANRSIITNKKNVDSIKKIVDCKENKTDCNKNKVVTTMKIDTCGSSNSQIDEVPCKEKNCRVKTNLYNKEIYTKQINPFFLSKKKEIPLKGMKCYEIFLPSEQMKISNDDVYSNNKIIDPCEKKRDNLENPHKRKKVIIEKDVGRKKYATWKKIKSPSETIFCIKNKNSGVNKVTHKMFIPDKLVMEYFKKQDSHCENNSVPLYATEPSFMKVSGLYKKKKESRKYGDLCEEKEHSCERKEKSKRDSSKRQGSHCGGKSKTDTGIVPEEQKYFSKSVNEGKYEGNICGKHKCLHQKKNESIKYGNKFENETYPYKWFYTCAKKIRECGFSAFRIEKTGLFSLFFKEFSSYSPLAVEKSDLPRNLPSSYSRLLLNGLEHSKENDKLNINEVLLPLSFSLFLFIDRTFFPLNHFQHERNLSTHTLNLDMDHFGSSMGYGINQDLKDQNETTAKKPQESFCNEEINELFNRRPLVSKLIVETHEDKRKCSVIGVLKFYNLNKRIKKQYELSTKENNYLKNETDGTSTN